MYSNNYYGPNTVTVQLLVGSQSFTVSQNFTVLPTVNSFSPQSGGVGTSVTISGSNFPSNNYYGGYSATVGGISASINYQSTSSLSLTIPNGITSSTTPITLNLNGVSVQVGDFTINSPVLSSISPNTGFIGSLITIQGSNILNDTGPQYYYSSNISVQVGGTTATNVNYTNNQITFYVPQGLSLGSYDITVTTPIRTLTVPNQITIAAPVITSLSSTSGYTGNYLTIYGQNLGSNIYNNSFVSMGAYNATAYSWTDTAIMIYIPYANPGSYRITINTGGQSVTAADSFTVLSN
jgi:hypothetical protein